LLGDLTPCKIILRIVLHRLSLEECKVSSVGLVALSLLILIEAHINTLVD